MPGYTSNLVSDLGERFSLRIDEKWLALTGVEPSIAWKNPLGTRLSVMFYDLEQGIEETAGVNYADSEIIGRAEGYKSYVGTNNKEIPLTFQFMAQGGNGNGANGDLADTLQRQVVDPTHWLDALKYPYTAPSGISYAPPRVILVIGKLITCRCVATDVSINWQAPFDPDTMLPYAAEVNCTFSIVRSAIKNYSANSQVWD